MAGLRLRPLLLRLSNYILVPWWRCLLTNNCLANTGSPTDIFRHTLIFFPCCLKLTSCFFAGLLSLTTDFSGGVCRRVWRVSVDRLIFLFIVSMYSTALRDSYMTYCDRLFLFLFKSPFRDLSFHFFNAKAEANGKKSSHGRSLSEWITLRYRWKSWDSICF